MADPAAALEIPFELIEKIASGAFGEVWRGSSPHDGRAVAVKRLHAHLAESGVLARFAREAELLSQLHSDHVVRYVAHGRDAAQRPWLATLWLEGDDLATWRSKESRSLREGLIVARDAALGAAAMHDAEMVHRDLKPGNVIVGTRDDGSPRAWVVDLGIAHMTNGTVLTETGMILGSPAYMAPEQVRGEGIDSRVDLWALGVVLYELLTGDTPFGSSNAIAVLGKVLLEPVLPLSIARPDLPPVLGQIVEGLLERDPRRRLASAADLARSLDRVLDDAQYASVMAGPIPTSRGSVAGGLTERVHAGERRLVALIFAQAASMSDDRDGRIAEAIQTFGGRVERLQNAWLGGFGLGRARGDELVAAARAAMAMEKHGARVALVSGWAEVRGGAVLAGKLIEIGASMLGRTKPGEVLVHSDAAVRLEGEFEFERRSADDARLVRERRAASLRPPGAPMLLLGRSVPAVGRDKETRLLEGVYAEAVDEHAARVAVIVGEAGLGKSRLRHEFIERIRASSPSPVVMSLRADPMLADVPNAALVKGLRETVGLEEGEEPAAAQIKLRAYAARLGLRDDDAIAFIAEFMHAASEHASPSVIAARQDPALMRQRVREALVSLFRHAAAAAPLLIAVDDLHWADRATVDLLAFLLEELRDEPVILLAFARPELHERHPTLWRGIARTELRLSPLSPRASEQLVASVLTLPDDERRSIAARAGGNPLFLEELVRARAAGLQEMPQAVHVVLQARLDGLGPDARRLAQAASVFGQTFWVEGVESLRSVQDVAPALAELAKAEIAVPRHASRFSQTTEYSFRHALVRDAAYAMLVDSERRELHARAAAWLEKAGEIDPAVVGQHYESGGRPALAIAHFARAAATALAESAFDEAERYATRAIDAGPEPAVAVETYLLRAEARRALGRSDAMLADAREARALAGNNPALQIRALSRMAEALHLVGDLEAADATLRAVLEESHASLLSSRIQALLELALVDLDAGRCAEASTLVDEALSWLRDADDSFASLRLRALAARIGALTAMGEFGMAQQAAKVALDAALTAGHKARAAEARAACARLAVLIGHASRARVDLEMVCAEASGLRVPHLEAVARSVLGTALAALGDLDAAIAEQTQAVTVARRIAAKHTVLVAETWRLVHMLERAQPGDAAMVLHHAPELLLAAAAHHPLRCVLHAVHARALLASASPERALEAAERAIDDLRALGGLDEHEDYVRLTYVRALDAAGRTREADTAIYQARERLQRKAGKLQLPADRTRFLEGVPAHREVLALASARVDRK